MDDIEHVHQRLPMLILQNEKVKILATCISLIIKCTVFLFVILVAVEQDYLSQARQPFDKKRSLLHLYIAGLLLSCQTPCSPCSALPEISPPHPNSFYIVTSAKRRHYINAIQH